MEFNKEKAKQLLNDGKTVSEVAKYFDMSYSSCWNRVDRMRENGEIATWKKLDYSKRRKVDAGKIKALFNAGWGIPEIMQETDETEETVRKVLGGVYVDTRKDSRQSD